MISIPKGQFKCKEYSYSPDGGGNVFLIYLCEGVGEVKMLRYENNKLFSTRVLTDYELK